jgi:hypothetical protein
LGSIGFGFHLWLFILLFGATPCFIIGLMHPRKTEFFWGFYCGIIGLFANPAAVAISLYWVVTHSVCLLLLWPFTHQPFSFRNVQTMVETLFTGLKLLVDQTFFLIPIVTFILILPALWVFSQISFKRINFTSPVLLWCCVLLFALPAIIAAIPNPLCSDASAIIMNIFITPAVFLGPLIIFSESMNHGRKNRRGEAAEAI